MRNYHKTNGVLVTGVAGFLGRHLIDRLILRGEDVECLDNFFIGNKQNIDHLFDHLRFELIRHDVTFPLYIEVDQIYNVACTARPIHYQHDTVQTTKTSVHGAVNMLGLAKRVGARIFQASTSEVYGNPTVHPQADSYWGNVNPIVIRSCYDEGKRCADTYKRGNKILIAGYGGSAADAQHFAGELVSRFNFDRPPLSAIALPTDTSIFTAIGNGYGSDDIFAWHLLANGRFSDVFIAISSSGNSKNILKALELAKKCSIETVGLTGNRGGGIGSTCNQVIAAPSISTPVIQ